MSNHAIRRKCVHCGEPFDSYNQRQTCSDDCRKARKRMQDSKCRAGGGIIGTTATCEICKRKYAITGTMQKYCSPKCGKRARVLSGVDTVKRIPAVCIICGKPFMTSKSSMAKTCGKECASKYRTSQVKAAAEFVATETRPLNYWSHSMSCPWATSSWDYMPPDVTSWDCAAMDPLTNRMEAGVWVNVQEVEARAA